MPLNLRKSKRPLPVPRNRTKLFPNSILNVNKSIPKLLQLFNAIYNKVYLLQKYGIIYKRRYNKNTNNSESEYTFNIKEFWNPIKNILKTNKLTSTWVPCKLSEEEQEEIMSNEEDSDRLSFYLSQLVKIPRYEPTLTLTNLLRIALNLGGYKGYIEGKGYIDKNMGNNHNPKFKFNNVYDFINPTNMVKLSKQINDSLVDKIMEYIDDVPEYPRQIIRNSTLRRKTPMTTNTLKNIMSKQKKEKLTKLHENISL